MFGKRLSLLGSVFGLLVLFLTPARANLITAASLTWGCSSYSISFTGLDFVIGTLFEVEYSITGLTTTPITGTISSTATSSTPTVRRLIALSQVALNMVSCPG